MLAQNFKSPADLKIADDLFRALVQVLGMLERGELKHVSPPVGIFGTPTGVGHTIGQFNMNWWAADVPDCGSVMCIGGTCEAIMGRAITGEPFDLFHLFYPGLALDAITPSQAAIAVRNYLTFGSARWHEAVRADND